MRKSPPPMKIKEIKPGATVSQLSRDGWLARHMKQESKTSRPAKGKGRRA